MTYDDTTFGRAKQKFRVQWLSGSGRISLAAPVFVFCLTSYANFP